MRNVAWAFHTKRFEILLTLDPDYSYQYDGDDEDGETQAKIDSGEYVAFDSEVSVYLDGEKIASDYLGSSVYDADNASEFWTAHRGPDPMNRNCSVMRSACGDNMCVGHYFPDMVRQAVREAREYLRNKEAPPYIRAAA